MSSSNGMYLETEVQARARRRTFTVAYKRKIVEEAARLLNRLRSITNSSDVQTF